MVNTGHFSNIPKIVGSGDSISYRKGLECLFHTHLGSCQLVKHDMLWCWMGWTTHYPEKMKVVTYHLTKPRYSYKQASISFFVDYGPQMLITSILMVPFEALGRVCDPRYLKTTIFASIGITR